MLLSSVQGLGSYNAHPHLCTPVAVTLGSAVRTGNRVKVLDSICMYELHKRLTSSTEHLAFIAVHQVTKNSPIHTKNNLGITAMVEGSGKSASQYMFTIASMNLNASKYHQRLEASEISLIHINKCFAVY